MLPLLRDRDLLEVEKKVKYIPMDIILFKTEVGDFWIAHRIIKVHNGKYVTRGDNNSKKDEWELKAEKIEGIVIARWRNGKRLKIYRGYLGFVQYRLYSTYFSFRQVLASSIGSYTLPEYIRNKLSAILPKPREVIFLKNEQKRMALYLGPIYIGTYSQQRKSWQIRFPWKMIYDYRTKIPDEKSSGCIDSDAYFIL